MSINNFLILAETTKRGYLKTDNPLIFLARPEGVEPSTFGRSKTSYNSILKYIRLVPIVLAI